MRTDKIYSRLSRAEERIQRNAAALDEINSQESAAFETYPDVPRAMIREQYDKLRWKLYPRRGLFEQLKLAYSYNSGVDEWAIWSTVCCIAGLFPSLIGIGFMFFGPVWGHGATSATIGAGFEFLGYVLYTPVYRKYGRIKE